MGSNERKTSVKAYLHTSIAECREKMCFFLAKYLDSEVLIHDFIHYECYTVKFFSAYIVYTPSGERWFATSVYKKGYFEPKRILIEERK